MIEIISPLIKQFLPFAQKRMGFKSPPKLFLRGDDKNAQNPLGKTAYYDPAQKSITIYITGRHPKDVMRSISHELVHHAQNCRGEFDKPHQMGDGYAQNDSHMREMEREAYEVGNMCFRDWEDGLKNTIYLEHLQKGDKKMSTKDWKNNELKSLLAESWGFKMDLSKLNENQKEYDLDENAEGRAFAPNHYCAHHVKFEGREAYTVDHNYDETLQEVTEYDLKFEDGTIQRNVPAAQLEVLEAFEGELEEAKHNRDHPPVKKVKKMREEEEEADHDEDDRDYKDARDAATRPGRSAKDRMAKRRSQRPAGGRLGESEEELEEGGAAQRRGDPRVRRQDPDRLREEEELEEDKMPDENNDGIPDYAQDGKGKNDQGKAKGVGDDNDKDEKEDHDDGDRDLSKVPPQLRKHVAKKKGVTKEELEAIVKKALKEALQKRKG